MRSFIHASVFLSLFVSTNAFLDAIPNWWNKKEEVIQNWWNNKAEVSEEALCYGHTLVDVATRDVPVLNNQQKSDILTSIKEIIVNSSVADRSNPDLVYKHAMLSGYTYCSTSQSIPTKGFLPEVGSLITGHFKVFRDPSNVSPEYQITVNHEQKTIVLAWRGSKTRQDYLYDIDGMLIGKDHSDFVKFNSRKNSTQSCQLSQDAEAFRGFVQSMPDNVAQIADILVKLTSFLPSYKFTITGHSLGGVKAMLFSYYVSNFFRDSLPIDGVYTFGQPIIGNRAFSNEIAECIGKEKIIRSMNEKDSVPHLRREKGVIDHADEVTVLYSPQHTLFDYNTCLGPNDPKCGSDLECKEMTTDYHGWFAGLPFGRFELCITN